MEKLKELTLIFDINRAIESRADDEKALDDVLMLINDSMRIHKGMISIYNSRIDEIIADISFGLSLEQKARAVYKKGEGIIGKVVKEGKTQAYAHLSDVDNFMDKTRSREALARRDISFICVPIIFKNDIIGAFSIDKFFYDEVSFLDDVRILEITGLLMSERASKRRDYIENNNITQEDILKQDAQSYL